MDLHPHLSNRQTQQLTVTTELKQALKILQLSTQELLQYIDEIILTNPMLDVIQPSLELIASDYPHRLISSSAHNHTNVEQYQNGNTPQVSLNEFLQSQAHIIIHNKTDLRISSFIIGNINPSGYLTMTVEEISNHLNISQNRVARVLAIVQSFDPPGIAAKSLKECLLLQLDHSEQKTKVLEQIITHHLEDIAANQYNKISSSLQITITETKKQIDIIKKLNPKPGYTYSYNWDKINYIIPDLLITKLEDRFVVTYCERSVPKLKINSIYKSVLNKSIMNADARHYLESKYKSAVFLINSIEQRRCTIMNIMDFIVEFQHGFLEHGLQHLKPMTLKTVSESINMHESTISRATNNKYVQTPKGVFSLKFFFASGIGESNDGSTSTDYVKKLIDSMIKSENKHKPYSDQKLSIMLKEKGIDVSRRTIAKYRDALQIPSTSKRKHH